MEIIGVDKTQQQKTQKNDAGNLRKKIEKIRIGQRKRNKGKEKSREHFAAKKKKTLRESR